MEKKTIAKKEVVTPAEMIREAVAGSADLDKLEKLLTIQERWEANEAKKAYHKAMAEFKKNPPKIDKDKTVSYKDVKYNHATLYNVVNKINAELSKYGLSASWSNQQNGTISVTCKITHILGHSEETTLSAQADTTGSKNSIQAIGSTITYLQRYTLLALTGLATADQDDDAKSASKPIEKITEKQLHSLRDNLVELNINEDKLVAYLKVDSLEDMTKAEYKKALVAIEQKRKGKK